MIYLYAIFANNCGACQAFKDKTLKEFLFFVKTLEKNSSVKYIQIDLPKMGQSSVVPPFLREFIPGYPSFLIIDQEKGTVKLFAHHITKDPNGKIKLISLPTKMESLPGWIQDNITNKDAPLIDLQTDKKEDVKICKYRIIGRRK